MQLRMTLQGVWGILYKPTYFVLRHSDSESQNLSIIPPVLGNPKTTPASPSIILPMRPHLASLVEDFRARVLADTSPNLIVGDPELLQALQGTGTREQRRESGSTATDNRELRTENYLPLPAILDHLPPEPLFTVDPSVTEQTPFQIVFTSGTTSEPRGIVHTHRNVLVTLAPIEREID